MIKMQRPTLPRVYSGARNALFDDVQDLLRTEDADPSVPPPPFVVAGSAAALTTAATLALAHANAGSNAASECGVPAYAPPLRQRVAGFYERHTKLTDTLAALGDVAASLDAVQHDIFAITGKVKSQEVRLKTLQAVSNEKRQAHAKMGSTLAKRIMNKRGTRSRLLLQAHDEAEQAAAHQAAHEAELEKNRSALTSKLDAKSRLEGDLVEYTRVAKELDEIDRTLFDGVTPEFPAEDVAEFEVKVWTQVQTFMQAESNREKRARQMLKEASPLLVSVLKDVQKALQFCIESGVASNQKYTRELTTNNTSRSTVRATQPLVLRAKTSSGKLFTTLAKARGSQMLVGPPPEFRLIELHHMPGSKNANAVDERGLHKSLETSYAQAKALDSYLKREIATSLERQKKLTAETAKLQSTVKEAVGHLRSVRRAIVTAVYREESGRQGASTGASQSELGMGNEGLAAQNARNPMISKHLNEDLRKEALIRLRRLVALPDPESDDDNLYPMIA